MHLIVSSFRHVDAGGPFGLQFSSGTKDLSPETSKPVLGLIQPRVQYVNGRPFVEVKWLGWEIHQSPLPEVETKNRWS